MPKDNHPPAFLLYVDDFASDGKVEAMTTLEVGAYFLLLCKAWREDPPGSIPNDDRVLARWARLTPDEWSGCRAGVLAAFTVGTDDRWHQKRMRKEFAKLIAKLREKSLAGKRAAAARWNHNECSPQYERNADASIPHMRNDAISTSIQIKKKTSTSDVANDADAIFISEEEILRYVDECNRIIQIVPLSNESSEQNRKDRSLVFKAIVLSRTVLGGSWLEDSLEAVRRHPEVENKAKYFHGVLRSKCREIGKNLNQLLKRVDVPKRILSTDGKNKNGKTSNGNADQSA